jgi:hypothetical protein
MGQSPIRRLLHPRSPNRTTIHPRNARSSQQMTLLGTDKTITRRNLRQLIAVNVFIIILDCSLMGLCFRTTSSCRASTKPLSMPLSFRLSSLSSISWGLRCRVGHRRIPDISVREMRCKEIGNWRSQPGYRNRGDLMRKMWK